MTWDDVERMHLAKEPLSEAAAEEPRKVGPEPEQDPSTSYSKWTARDLETLRGHSNA